MMVCRQLNVINEEEVVVCGTNAYSPLCPRHGRNVSQPSLIFDACQPDTIILEFPLLLVCRCREANTPTRASALTILITIKERPGRLLRYVSSLSFLNWRLFIRNLLRAVCWNRLGFLQFGSTYLQRSLNI